MTTKTASQIRPGDSIKMGKDDFRTVATVEPYYESLKITFTDAPAGKCSWISCPATRKFRVA